MAQRTPHGLWWVLDDLVDFRGRAWLSGWVWHDSSEVAGVEVRLDHEPLATAALGLQRPDPHRVAGDAPASAGVAAELALPSGRYADELSLRVRLADGSAEDLVDLHGPATDLDRYHALEQRFWELVGQRPPGRVVELGSRDRSGTVHRDRAAPHAYLGTDLVDGPNVDLVCDAHEIDRHVTAGTVDGCFAMATFEHVLMPWKAVLAINRVLKPGGLLFISSHQTFPLHELPSDYWRYSNDGWRGLLNPHTGFAIRDVAMGEPAMIVPSLSHPAVRDMPQGLAYLGAAVVAEKIDDTRLSWDVAAGEVAAGEYPD